VTRISKKEKNHVKIVKTKNRKEKMKKKRNGKERRMMTNVSQDSSKKKITMTKIMTIKNLITITHKEKAPVLVPEEKDLVQEKAPTRENQRTGRTTKMT